MQPPALLTSHPRAMPLQELVGTVLVRRWALLESHVCSVGVWEDFSYQLNNARRDAHAIATPEDAMNGARVHLVERATRNIGRKSMFAIHGLKEVRIGVAMAWVAVAVMTVHCIWDEKDDIDEQRWWRRDRNERGRVGRSSVVWQ